MTDDERIELYRELILVFLEAGLGWMADEVTSVVDQGVEEEVSAIEWTGAGKPKRGDLRVTRREYSPLERIVLLLDAAARVVNHGHAVELAVAHYFGGVDKDSARQSVPMKVRFLPESRDYEEESAGFEVGPYNDLAARTAAIASFLRQLSSVREQASR